MEENNKGDDRDINNNTQTTPLPTVAAVPVSKENNPECEAAEDPTAVNKVRPDYENSLNALLKKNDPPGNECLMSIWRPELTVGWLIQGLIMPLKFSWITSGQQ